MLFLLLCLPLLSMGQGTDPSGGGPPPIGPPGSSGGGSLPNGEPMLIFYPKSPNTCPLARFVWTINPTSSHTFNNRIKGVVDNTIIAFSELPRNYSTVDADGVQLKSIDLNFTLPDGQHTIEVYGCKGTGTNNCPSDHVQYTYTWWQISDDPTKPTPFNCHNAAPLGETVLNGMLDKNHCQEVHVATSQFKSFWAAVGIWKYAHYARGECASKFNTKDSIKHDVNWPTAIVIKKGEAATLFAAVATVDGPDCSDNKCLYVITNPTSPEGKQHCLELDNPPGTAGGYWAEKGWKYTSPPWTQGKCDRNRYNFVNKETQDLDGFAGVVFWRLGIQVYEATLNTKEKATRDTKYKGVYYVKRGKKTSLRKIITKEHIIRPTSPNADNETILHDYPDKNHCLEIFVPTIDYKKWWRAIGKWQFPNAIDGYCEDKYNSCTMIPDFPPVPPIHYNKCTITSLRVDGKEDDDCESVSCCAATQDACDNGGSAYCTNPSMCGSGGQGVICYSRPCSGSDGNCDC